MNEGDEIQKEKQDLLRYSRAVEMLIKVIQVPFKNPPGFEDVVGFNPNGIDLEQIKDYPYFKLTCWNTYDILADVDSRPFPVSPFSCPYLSLPDLVSKWRNEEERSVYRPVHPLFPDPGRLRHQHCRNAP